MQQRYITKTFLHLSHALLDAQQRLLDELNYMNVSDSATG